MLNCLGEHHPRSGIILSHGEFSNSRGRPPLRPVAVHCQWVDVNFDVLVAIGGARVDVASLAIGICAQLSLFRLYIDGSDHF